MLLPMYDDKMPQTGTGMTPLHYSALHEQVEVTKTLIKAINDSSMLNQVKRVAVSNFEKTIILAYINKAMVFCSPRLEFRLNPH